MLNSYFKIFFYDILLTNIRTKYFSDNLFSILLKVSLSLLGVLWVVLLGWKIVPILKVLYSSENPYFLINHYLIVLIIGTYVWRTLKSSGNYFTITPFLILHISKIYLIWYIILRNIINKVSIKFCIFFFSLSLFNIIPKHSLQIGLLWFTSAILLLLIFELFLYISNILSMNYTFVIICSIIFQFVIFYLLLNFYSRKYGLLNPLFLNDNTLFLILLISVVALFIIAIFLTKKNIYIDIVRKKFSSQLYSLQFLLNKTPLIWLQIMLITRNKLLRKFLLSNFILVLAGLIIGFFSHPVHIDQKIIGIMLALIFVTGYFFILPYGSNIFGWENHYNGFIFTKNIFLKQYLISKILFIQYYWLIMSVIIALFTPILDLHYSSLILMFIIYFYSILTNAIVFQAIYSYQARNPDTSGLQYFSKITYITGCTTTLPFLLFFLINGGRIDFNLSFLISLLSISLLGLLTQQITNKKLYDYLVKNKYKIIGK